MNSKSNFPNSDEAIFVVPAILIIYGIILFIIAGLGCIADLYFR